MLGLENTKIFTLLMVAGVVTVATIIAVITGLRGNFELFRSEAVLPRGVAGVRFYVGLRQCLLHFINIVKYHMVTTPNEKNMIDIYRQFSFI